MGDGVYGCAALSRECASEVQIKSRVNAPVRSKSYYYVESVLGERVNDYDKPAMAPFASLKKQAETLFRLICRERKTLF